MQSSLSLVQKKFFSVLLLFLENERAKEPNKIQGKIAIEAKKSTMKIYFTENYIY